MPRIFVLPEHVASQIAAGEVVERPSSAVKELVENAIDAGATRIVVDISEGCRHIRVADNGSGMTPDDASLAFQRHATSKLATADDLWQLGTLGFRGEALPSIAAVSHLTCQTRVENNDIGTKVVCAEGTITISETGCAKGTIIEVEDLFYNVPARLKFLKKAATEFAFIHEIIQSLALTYPEIAFQLSLDGKARLATHGSGKIDQALRECGFFSAETSSSENKLIPLEARDGVLGLELTGRLASAVSFRGDRKGILTIVNGRPVRCGLTYKALDNAYADLIPRGRYPLAIVHLKVNPAELDINIHPTKKEIRYSKGNDVYLFLQRQIAHALRMARNIHADLATRPASVGIYSTPTLPAAPELDFNPQSFVYVPERSTQLSVGAAVSPPVFSSPLRESRSYNPDGERRFERADKSRPYDAGEELLSERAQRPQGISFRAGLPLNPDDKYEHTPLQEPVMPTTAPSTLPLDWQIAGYIRNSYILIETKSGLSIIEQHIAHERVLYEQLLTRMDKTNAASDERQNIIISLPLELTEEQKSVLKENLPALERQGFEFEIEDQNISCSQVPIELAHKDYAKIIQTMLQELAENSSANPQLEIIKSLACQAAIKNGMPLAQGQVIDLLNLWYTAPRNETCPHGRPIQLDFSYDKLFQLFHPA